MSQIYKNTGSTPAPDVEFLEGNSGGAVAPDGSHIVYTVGTGSITIVGNPGTNTLTTQLTGLTNHSLLVGAGTATLTNLGVATDGQIPIGSTGADPVLAVPTSSGGTITISTGAGTLNFETAGGIATEYDTDVNSPANPALGVLNVVGGSSTDNNADGIQTDGSSGSNTVTVQLTNRTPGTGQTVGNVTDDVITFAMGGSARTCSFFVYVAAFESTTPAGASYKIFGGVRTTGAAATLCGVPDIITNEEAALTAASVSLIVSGNNAIVRVTGVLGLTINWTAQLTYIEAA